MQALKTAIEDRKNYRHREGALFAVEQLTVVLGRLFEPYVVHLLPNLLHCYGDGNQYVREVSTVKVVSLQSCDMSLQSCDMSLQSCDMSLQSCDRPDSSACMHMFALHTCHVLPPPPPPQATVGASRAIMARLSGHGVKLILPDLLKGLEDDSWRTKAGA